MKYLIFLFALFFFLHSGRNKNQNETHLLPEINSVKYLHANTAFELKFPKGKSFNDSLLKFLRIYKDSLPPISGYNTYLVRVSCDIDSTTSSVCYHEFGSLSYDLLLLYEPNIKQATVINVAYNFLGDAFDESMSFTINSNVIKLEESYLADSDPDENDEIDAVDNLRKKHTIRISDKGKISITEAE
ncbi:MAG TPA: hypothetical protein DIW47_12540 [Bacteroidetes bacterium]|nr:hypothetical protein [Bacteroidota bacterium]